MRRNTRVVQPACSKISVVGSCTLEEDKGEPSLNILLIRRTFIRTSMTLKEKNENLFRNGRLSTVIDKNLGHLLLPHKAGMCNAAFFRKQFRPLVICYRKELFLLLDLFKIATFKGQPYFSLALRGKRPFSMLIAQRPHSNKSDLNLVSQTTLSSMWQKPVGRESWHKLWAATKQSLHLRSEMLFEDFFLRLCIKRF